MDFGDAIKAVKVGKKISRLGWNGKSQYIILAECEGFNSTANYNSHWHDCIGNKFLLFVGISGYQVGWLASQADMLADDWVTLEG